MTAFVPIPVEGDQIAFAWAAGFFDGEGCTTLGRRGQNAHARCLISQKDRRVLDKFLAIVGVGTIYVSDRHPVPFRWQTTSEPDARLVLSKLWPFLGEMKRDQALRVFGASTWHDGNRQQLRCQDPTHEIVPRRNGGRRCRTCAREHMKRWKAARRERLALETA